MTIVSLAIFSARHSQKSIQEGNGTLNYIRDFQPLSAIDKDEFDSVDNFEEDLFPIDDNLRPLTYQPSWDSCSLRHQFLLQAALDQALQMDVDKMIRDSDSNDMSLGLICAMEDVLFYGYRTNSHVYFVLGVQDDVLPGDDGAQWNKRKQIRSLLKTMHSKYVEYRLNPFSSLHGTIKSKRFDGEIERMVTSANVSWLA